MRRNTVLVSLLLSASILMSSCNRKLKEDIKELEAQVNDLKSQNDELKSILGTNEPIFATTTFKTDNDSTVIVRGNYRFKSNDYNTQYIEDKGDGTYYVHIERFGDIDWREGAYLNFTYNLAKDSVYNKQGGQYWEDADQYTNYAYYSQNSNPSPTTFNLTLTHLDVTTGDISLLFSASYDDAASANSPSWSVPNQGKSVTTSFSFTGKLGVFKRSI